MRQVFFFCNVFFFQVFAVIDYQWIFLFPPFAKLQKGDADWEFSPEPLSTSETLKTSQILF